MIRRLITAAMLLVAAIAAPGLAGSTAHAAGGIVWTLYYDVPNSDYAAGASVDWRISISVPNGLGGTTTTTYVFCNYPSSCVDGGTYQIQPGIYNATEQDWSTKSGFTSCIYKKEGSISDPPTAGSNTTVTTYPQTCY